MAQPTTIKGGKVRVLLDPAGSGSYAAPCGFSDRSVTFTKGLQEVNLADCDDPDAVPWLAQDSTGLSIAVSGQGVLAEESVATWLDAWESEDSVAAKVEIELSSGTRTYTGALQIASVEIGATVARRVTLNVTAQSDGTMAKTGDW